MTVYRYLGGATSIALVSLLAGCATLGFNSPDADSSTSPDKPADAGAAAPADSKKAEQDNAAAELDKTVAQKADDLAGAFAERAAARQSKSDLDGALADLNRVVELEPGNAVARLDRGQIKLSRNDLDGAIADYSSAIDSLSGTNPAHAAGADALHHLLTGLFPGMIQNDLANAYYLRGAARQAKGDIDGAVSDLNQAISQASDFSAAYNNRGVIKGMMLSDAQGAMSDFNRAISLQPKAADAYANRGNIEIALNDPDDAMKDFGRAIDLDPSWSAAYFGRAFGKQRSGDLDGAIADLGKAIELKPAYLDAYFNRAIDYERKGDLGSAIADYDKVLALNPESADAYANRGLDKYRKNDIDSAIADFNKAIELKRDMVKAYMERAVAEKIKGNLDGAIADYGKVIQMADKDAGVYPQLYRSLFIMQAHRGDPRKDLAGVVATWPAGWTKAVGRYLTGDLTESALLAEAEQGDPRAASSQRCDAFYFVGAVHLLAGESTAARNFFQECVATERPDLFSFKFAQSDLARVSTGP